MSRRLKKKSSELLKRDLVAFLSDFEKALQKKDLRKKVVALIPAFHAMRNLGSSLIPRSTARSARDRILHYFLKYPLTVIHGDELMVVSGIQDYPRRIRELRVQFGWSIASGVTLAQMNATGEVIDDKFPKLRPEEYILLVAEQDRGAAHRWNVANEIRREKASVKTKILKYLRGNVGTEVTGEELRYVAGNRTEWARRVRELRTEEGWPIVTNNTGRPDLGVGIYLLEQDRQSLAHDRNIPDPVRRSVLVRDGYVCKSCGWSHKQWNRSDPRHLELHHIRPHVERGENTGDNLVTLCTVCHDDVHRKVKNVKKTH